MKIKVRFKNPLKKEGKAKESKIKDAERLKALAKEWTRYSEQIEMLSAKKTEACKKAMTGENINDIRNLDRDIAMAMDLRDKTQKAMQEIGKGKLEWCKTVLPVTVMVAVFGAGCYFDAKGNMLSGTKKVALGEVIKKVFGKL